MPNPMVHLWLAEQICSQLPRYKHPDFFLGCILPDAVLSRKGITEQDKCLTHLLNCRETWKEDVLTAFRKLKTPSLLEIGYYTHILTDIKARIYMRTFFDAHNVPHEQREEYHRQLIPFVNRKLFESEQNYFDCVSFAKKFEVFEFPFGITLDDVKSDFSYAYCIFELEKTKVSERDLPFQLPDFREWGAEWITSLREDLYGL